LGIDKDQVVLHRLGQHPHLLQALRLLLMDLIWSGLQFDLIWFTVCFILFWFGGWINLICSVLFSSLLLWYLI